MTRDDFREAVFARDNKLCVFCGIAAVDAHHLIERRLWQDGGYHVNNGISVCGPCHIACEQTIYSVEEGRTAAGITKIIVPDHFEADTSYDKWGNVILEDGKRAPGELFYDESVQKILKEGGVLDLFVQYMKYPRTYHLPWSSCQTKSDRILTNTDHFKGKTVVVTEKLDGENTSLYQDKIHARSINGKSHLSQGWVRNFHAQIAHNIPFGFRICGENLYARHSILYQALPSYFMGFSVWTGMDCLGWDQTMEWFELLDITPVPVLYEGRFEGIDWDGFERDTQRLNREGYVVRLADTFHIRDFRTSVAKYVRPNHIQNAHRWDANFVRNELGATG